MVEMFSCCCGFGCKIFRFFPGGWFVEILVESWEVTLPWESLRGSEVVVGLVWGWLDVLQKKYNNNNLHTEELYTFFDQTTTKISTNNVNEAGDVYSKNMCVFYNFYVCRQQSSSSVVRLLTKAYINRHLLIIKWILQKITDPFNEQALTHVL